MHPSAAHFLLRLLLWPAALDEAYVALVLRDMFAISRDAREAHAAGNVAGVLTALERADVMVLAVGGYAHVVCLVMRAHTKLWDIITGTAAAGLEPAMRLRAAEEISGLVAASALWLRTPASALAAIVRNPCVALWLMSLLRDSEALAVAGLGLLCRGAAAGGDVWASWHAAGLVTPLLEVIALLLQRLGGTAAVQTAAAQLVTALACAGGLAATEAVLETGVFDLLVTLLSPAVCTPDAAEHMLHAVATLCAACTDCHRRFLDGYGHEGTAHVAAWLHCPQVCNAAASALSFTAAHCAPLQERYMEGGALAPLVAMLRDRVTCVNALRGLRSLATGKRDVSDIIASVKGMLAFLCDGVACLDREVRLESLALLAELLPSRTHAQDAVADSLPTICRLCSSADDDMVSVAVWALRGAVAEHPDNSAAVMELLGTGGAALYARLSAADNRI